MFYSPIYKQPKFDFIFVTKPNQFNLPKIKTPLKWLDNSIDIRQNIKKWHKTSKALIIVGITYARKPNKLAYNKYYLRISEYSALRDYHKVIYDKLKNLLKIIKRSIKDLKPAYNLKKLDCKIFVDSSPVYEKGYFLAGLQAYLGKNSLLLSNIGSKFLIGGISLNIALSILQKILNNKRIFLYETKNLNLDKYSNKPKYLCTQCNLCITKCPTGAINSNGFKINIPLCISYLTVESKGIIPEFLQKRMKNWLFGCDECQNTCPYNKKYQLTLNKNELQLRFGKILPTIIYFRQAKGFSYHGFYKYFAGTPVIRMGYIKFKNRVVTYIKQSLLKR